MYVVSGFSRTDVCSVRLQPDDVGSGFQPDLRVVLLDANRAESLLSDDIANVTDHSAISTQEHVEVGHTGDGRLDQWRDSSDGTAPVTGRLR